MNVNVFRMPFVYFTRHCRFADVFCDDLPCWVNGSVSPKALRRVFLALRNLLRSRLRLHIVAKLFLAAGCPLSAMLRTALRSASVNPFWDCLLAYSEIVSEGNRTKFSKIVISALQAQNVGNFLRHIRKMKSRHEVGTNLRRHTTEIKKSNTIKVVTFHEVRNCST